MQTTYLYTSVRVPWMRINPLYFQIEKECYSASKKSCRDGNNVSTPTFTGLFCCFNFLILIPVIHILQYTCSNLSSYQEYYLGTQYIHATILPCTFQAGPQSCCTFPAHSSHVPCMQIHLQLSGRCSSTAESKGQIDEVDHSNLLHHVGRYDRQLWVILSTTRPRQQLPTTAWVLWPVGLWRLRSQRQ